MSRAKLFALPFLALAGFALSAPGHARTADAEAEATSAEAEAAAEAMEGSWTIVQNTTNSPEHNMLSKALSAAGLNATLSAAGPFTLFAPTDAAFSAVPQPMTDYLMNPLNKDSLAQVLTYHVVPGKVTAEDLYKKIKAGGGTAKLTTVEGQELTFTEVQGNIKVDGTQGSSGYVTQADVAQSNGVVHVLNGVLIPNITPPSTEPAADAAAPATDAAAQAPEAAATN